MSKTTAKLSIQEQTIKDHQDAEEKAFYESYEGKARPINPTGMHPVEYKCLVRLDPVDEYVGQNKTIIAPDIDRDRRQQAETFATVIEVGSRAFEEIKQVGGLVPKPGDMILLEAYSGAPPKKGDFENLYRFCNDKDIIAVIDSE